MKKSFLMVAVAGAGILFSHASTNASPHGLKLEPVKGADVSLVHKVHNCHADMRYNYVPGVGGRALHRHTGSCRPVLADVSHCHSGPQRHRHRGYGTVTHNHYGRSCQVDVWRERRNPGNARGCVRIGPVTFCQ